MLGASTEKRQHNRRNILLTVSYDGTDFCGWQRQDRRIPQADGGGERLMPLVTGRFDTRPTVALNDQTGDGCLPPVAGGERKRGGGGGNKEYSESGNKGRGKLGADKTERTVQGVLEDALARLHGEATPVCGSGRTDSGVHALAQAVTFTSPIDSIPVDRYPRAINCFLPDDVRVTKAKEVGEGFSARFSATSRVYRYFLCTDPFPAACVPRYAWCIHRDVDIDLLNSFACELHGETDCASFAASDGGGADADAGAPHSTCRYIDCMQFFVQEAFPFGRLAVFEIEANAFLYHMVRNLVGTLLLLERKKAAAGSLAAIAQLHDRAKAGACAPPQGLFLWDVRFDGVRRNG